MKPPIKVGSRRKTNWYSGIHTPRSTVVVITSVRRDADYGTGWCVTWRVPKCKCCGHEPYAPSGEVDAGWVGVKT